MPSDGTQKKESSGWQHCGSSRVSADTGNKAAGAGWAVEAVQALSILPDEDNFPWGKLFWKRPQGNTRSLAITLLLHDWFRQMWVSQLSLWLWLCGSNGGAPTAQAPRPVMCCDTQLLICRTGEPRIQGNISCGHERAAEEVATLWLEAVMMSGRWLRPQDSSEGSVMWPVVGSLLEVSGVLVLRQSEVMPTWLLTAPAQHSLGHDAFCSASGRRGLFIGKNPWGNSLCILKLWGLSYTCVPCSYAFSYVLDPEDLPSYNL